jgi:hypothetical protein
MEIDEENFRVDIESIQLKKLRKEIRRFLKSKTVSSESSFFKDNNTYINLGEELSKIKGSYFGLLNGEYPIHLVSEKPLENINEDKVKAKIYVHKESENAYVSLEIAENSPLYFELPEDIAKILFKVWRNKNQVANSKEKYLGHITLNGEIDGIRRSIKVELDKEWLKEYLDNIWTSS